MDVTKVVSAFPQYLADEAARIAHLIPDGQFPPKEDTIGPITVGGNELRIPWRIYSPELSAASINGLKVRERLMMCCWYTRHHDGLVRQKYVNELFPVADEWCLPFVVQLVGEYIAEIVEVINENVASVSAELCSQFSQDNEQFLALTRDRVISYRLYYRSRYPTLRDYPGFQILNSLGFWHGRQGRRLLEPNVDQ